MAGGEILYWIGCVASYRLQHIAKATFKALRKLGLNPLVLGSKEGCCGDILFLSGQYKEALENARRVAETINSTGVNLLVTGCSGCFRAFSTVYRKEGIGLKPTVLHTSQLLEKLIVEGRVKFKELKIKATYHDPCELGRMVGVYEPPRRVLTAIPGLQLVEMPMNRMFARCCGAGGGFFGLYPDVAQDIGRLRVNDALQTGSKALITSCPTCYLNFYYIVEREELPIEVYDLMEIVNEAL